MYVVFSCTRLCADLHGCAWNGCTHFHISHARRYGLCHLQDGGEQVRCHLIAFRNIDFAAQSAEMIQEIRNMAQ